jgi:hypothetical protein
MSLVSVVPTEDVVVSTAIEIVQACAIGIITYAVSRGFNDPSDESIVYHTLVYIVDMLTQTMRNSTLTVQKVPKFLKKILDAIKPKKVNIASGSMGFVWTTDFNPLATTDVYNMSPSAAPRDWNAKITSGSFINGFIPVLTNASAYTAENGAAAWSKLLNFLSAFPDCPWATLVDVIGGKVTKNFTDASAFTNNKQIIGDSGSGNGGYCKNSTLEVPVQFPLFAVFAANVAGETGDPYRTPRYSIMTAGDACSLGWFLASNFNDKMDRGRIACVYKSVDFNRLLDIVGRWMSKVAQMAFDDIQTNAAWQNDPNYLTCPLTFQEFSIMMRNICTNVFQDTQGGVQNNLPGSSLNVSNNFLPFVIGPNTRPVEQTSAELPLFFVEALRSLTARSQRHENPYSVFPVLGTYELDILNGNMYGYTSNMEPTQGFISVFTPPPLEMDPKTKKFVGVEVAISMVDGSYGAGYAKINDPNAIAIYTQNWNEWVAKIKPFTSRVGTLGKDGGIPGLQVLTFTEITYENIDGSKTLIPRKHKVDKERKVPERLKQKTLGISNYYDTRLIDVTSCSQIPIANVWQTVQQYWPKPEIMEFGVGSDNEKMDPKKWQTYAMEPVSIQNPPGSTNTSIAQLNDLFADQMVRARNGEVTEAVQLVEKLGEQGNGGIFASVLGTIGKIAVHTLAAPGVIDGMVGMLPF